MASITFTIEFKPTRNLPNDISRAIILITAANLRTPAKAENPAYNNTRRANRDQDEVNKKRRL